MNAATPKHPTSVGSVLTLIAVLVCLPSALLAQSAAVAEAASDKSWTLSERSLPAPQGASDALRDAVASTPAPNVAQRKGMTTLSDDQWKAMQQGQAVDLFEEVCGARLTYNYVRIGGVSADITPGWTDRVRDFLDYFEPEYGLR